MLLVLLLHLPRFAATVLLPLLSLLLLLLLVLLLELPWFPAAVELMFLTLLLLLLLTLLLLLLAVSGRGCSDVVA